MLADYDQGGCWGTREEMIDTADQRWLADHLSGETSMLLTTTNVQSVEGPEGTRRAGVAGTRGHSGPGGRQ